MTFDSPLTFVALAIPPIVAVVFVASYVFRRDPIAQPSIVAAVPFGLSSIAILLAQSAAILLATFNEIASRRAAGLGAVISGLLRAQRPLGWGFVDFGVSLTVIFLASAFLRYSGDAEQPVIHAYLSLPPLIVTAAALIGLFLIAYLQYGTVDLVMMIVDNQRYHELVSQFGVVSPGYFAARISSRLVAVTFLSIAEICALIIAGVISLPWRQKQDSRRAFATILTLGAFVGCAVSALNEFGFVDYLQHVR